MAWTRRWEISSDDRQEGLGLLGDHVLLHGTDPITGTGRIVALDARTGETVATSSLGDARVDVMLSDGRGCLAVVRGPRTSLVRVSVSGDRVDTTLLAELQDTGQPFAAAAFRLDATDFDVYLEQDFTLVSDLIIFETRRTRVRGSGSTVSSTWSEFSSGQTGRISLREDGGQVYVLGRQGAELVSPAGVGVTVQDLSSRYPSLYGGTASSPALSPASWGWATDGGVLLTSGATAARSGAGPTPGEQVLDVLGVTSPGATALQPVAVVDEAFSTVQSCRVLGVARSGASVEVVGDAGGSFAATHFAWIGARAFVALYMADSSGLPQAYVRRFEQPLQTELRRGPVSSRAAFS